MEKSKLIDILRTVFEKEEKIVAAYLFGSRENGVPIPSSDVDIGVFFDERASLEELIRLQNAVEDITEYRADVVDLKTANPYLALDIVRGNRFLCTDKFRSDEFELYVLARAGDLAPFERERRAVLLGMEG